MFPSLTEVGSTLRIGGSSNLTLLTGIGALLQVESIYINSNPLLQSVPPFPGVIEITYDLLLSKLGISDLAGRFPNLVKVYNSFLITVPPLDDYPPHSL